MKYLHFLILLIATLYLPSAWGQCATGVDTGGQCIPPDALEPQGNSKQQAQPQQPRIIWLSRWGAIAIDSTTAQIGAAVNRANKTDAAARAMHDCGSAGSQHCEVEVTYENQCVALAWGTAYWGLGLGPDLDSARSVAMKRCEKGASDCKTLYRACSVAVRAQ